MGGNEGYRLCTNQIIFNLMILIFTNKYFWFRFDHVGTDDFISLILTQIQFFIFIILLML